MKINGTEKTLEQPTTLGIYLEEEGYNCSRIAVELNGRIIPKTLYQETSLSDADTLEIVHFVGGG